MLIRAEASDIGLVRVECRGDEVEKPERPKHAQKVVRGDASVTLFESAESALGNTGAVC